jgi:hypothetical protein
MDTPILIFFCGFSWHPAPASRMAQDAAANPLNLIRPLNKAPEGKRNARAIQ